MRRTTTRSEPVFIDKMSRATEVTDILVVDDLAEKLLVYRTVLENPELNIITARSGPEALKKVLEGDFAVILLDVSMPGMDGFETAQLIRQRKRSSATPIIFLTAFTDDMRMAQGYASGAVDYIPTPVVPEILRAKVQVFVELFQMRRLSAQQAEERAKRASAEEAARRSTFLAEAGAAITRPLDLAGLLDALARAPVPFLADICVLSMGDEHGHKEVKCVWRSADEPAGAEEPGSIANYPFPWLGKALDRAMAIDEPQVMDVLPSAGPIDGMGAPDMDGGNALILPMSSRQGMRGAMALIRGKGHPVYRPDEVALAREFVSRSCIALENVLLVQGMQEADRRKDEFLGMLAHELRNPLAPLRNAVDILDLLEQQDPLLDDARAIMDRQVTHMTRLVDDLLDATRIARGKVLLRKEPCDMVAVVQQTAADYRRLFETASVRFRLDTPEHPLHVYGDPTRLAQSVGNLLHNAHKFTDAGGEVTLSLRPGEAGWLDLTVQDSGVGIDPGLLPHVFDVFRQADQGLDRNRGGLGLGLTLVKGLVELHGGTVEVTSTGSGQGTTFLVRLPLEQPSSTTRKKVAVPQLMPVSKHRILVIDDNRDAAESMKMLLEHDRHETMVASTGPDGLESARSFKPDVIICDIGLPGMDGYQVARTLRSTPETREIYLIALTGYGREEDQARSHEAGFSVHMTKPIDFRALRKVLAGSR